MASLEVLFTVKAFLVGVVKAVVLFFVLCLVLGTLREGYQHLGLTGEDESKAKGKTTMRDAVLKIMHTRRRTGSLHIGKQPSEPPPQTLRVRHTRESSSFARSVTSRSGRSRGGDEDGGSNTLYDTIPVRKLLPALESDNSGENQSRTDLSPSRRPVLARQNSLHRIQEKRPSLAGIKPKTRKIISSKRGKKTQRLEDQWSKFVQKHSKEGYSSEGEESFPSDVSEPDSLKVSDGVGTDPPIKDQAELGESQPVPTPRHRRKRSPRRIVSVVGYCIGIFMALFLLFSWTLASSCLRARSNGIDKDATLVVVCKSCVNYSRDLATSHFSDSGSRSSSPLEPGAGRLCNDMLALAPLVQGAKALKTVECVVGHFLPSFTPLHTLGQVLPSWIDNDSFVYVLDSAVYGTIPLVKESWSLVMSKTEALLVQSPVADRKEWQQEKVFIGATEDLKDVKKEMKESQALIGDSFPLLLVLGIAAIAWMLGGSRSTDSSRVKNGVSSADKRDLTDDSTVSHLSPIKILDSKEDSGSASMHPEAFSAGGNGSLSSSSTDLADDDDLLSAFGKSKVGADSRQTLPQGQGQPLEAHTPQGEELDADHPWELQAEMLWENLSESVSLDLLTASSQMNPNASHFIARPPPVRPRLGRLSREDSSGVQHEVRSTLSATHGRFDFAHPISTRSNASAPVNSLRRREFSFPDPILQTEMRQLLHRKRRDAEQFRLEQLTERSEATLERIAASLKVKIDDKCLESARKSIQAITKSIYQKRAVLFEEDEDTKPN